MDSGPPNVILIREPSPSGTVCSTFDYSDLLSYLLVVLGTFRHVAVETTTPNEDELEAITMIAKKAAEGAKITLNDIRILARKEPVVTLTDDEALSKAIQHFGSGVHRVIILKDGEICGILSQLKLLKFLWENARCFPVLEQLYPIAIRDLEIGSHQIVSINGDKPLIDALQLMHLEGLTSVAVVDTAFNVIGNISNADVKLLTNSRSLPLFNSSCIHFISVILNERGVEDGQDSYPQVTPHPSIPTPINDCTFSGCFMSILHNLFHRLSPKLWQQMHTDYGLSMMLRLQRALRQLH